MFHVSDVRMLHRGDLIEFTINLIKGSMPDPDILG